MIFIQAEEFPGKAALVPGARRYTGSVATAVYLRLRDGRRVRFGRLEDAASAAKVKGSVEEWIREGMTLSVANSRGELEDVSPRHVEMVELAEETTPARGSERLSR